MTREELARAYAPTLRLQAAAFIGMAERMKMAKNGVAMPDGSYPIPDEAHLKSAIHLAHTPAEREHTIRRAHALGLANAIPTEWMQQK